MVELDAKCCCCYSFSPSKNENHIRMAFVRCRNSTFLLYCGKSTFHRFRSFIFGLHIQREKKTWFVRMLLISSEMLFSIYYTQFSSKYSIACAISFFFCWPVRSFAKQRTGLLYGAVVYKYISLSTFHFIPPALGRKFRFSAIAIFC